MFNNSFKHCCSYFFIITIILCSTSCNQSTINSKEKVEPIHVRVIWTENPSNHAIISWTTLHANGGPHYVYYDTISHRGNLKAYTYKRKAKVNGQITMVEEDREKGVPPGYYHHSEISNLKAATAYYFVVESSGVISEEYYFITAPDDDRPVSIIWGSDSRAGGEREFSPTFSKLLPDIIENTALHEIKGHEARQRMNEVITQIFEDNKNVIAFTHGADYGLTAQWRHLYWWLEDQQAIVAGDNRLLPLIISRGNHDTEIGFKENFWLGNSIEGRTLDTFYYTSNLSAHASLITLNTEISVTGEQRVWLNKTLSLIRGKKRWVVVHYHRPAYPAVKAFKGQTFTRVRNAFVPLFEKHNVDLVAESDGHVLKRTLPIRNGKHDKSGIVYIGEGGLGVPQRPVTDSTRWYVQSPGYAISSHHVHVINFNKDNLHVQAIGIDGEVIDNFIRQPRAKVSTPPTSPKHVR
ncbi:purple acid phosphatase family protein [Pontibacter ruber]|uniref:Fibronectin type III domain-containing protein n=1 Tax=Pontibacter ruber TaxID=1343895 RepID=A0ABW5CRI4_9BACT|nr:metallophosphoesterase family protein [Pontibacter ruber]